MELKARIIEIKRDGEAGESAARGAGENPVKRYAEQVLAEYGNRLLHPYEQSPIDDLARLYAVLARVEAYKKTVGKAGK